MRISANNSNTDKAILDVIERIWLQKKFDALIIPRALPGKESYVYTLMKDISLLHTARALPPVMSVQGGKAISYLTKNGVSKENVVCIMRPCEIQAAIELAKLHQANLKNLLLISIDCPGVLPFHDYISQPGKGEDIFNTILTDWENPHNEKIRPVCTTCLNSTTPVGDIHIGITVSQHMFHLLWVPNTEKGEEFLTYSELKSSDNAAEWEKKAGKIQSIRKEERRKFEAKMQEQVFGLENLAKTFHLCIGCRNCREVCPICYCRQCYADSDDTKYELKEYLERAKIKGSVKFPDDTLLFHLSRMAHMSISCVGCGTCEDACPVGLPVAQVFNFVRFQSQALFSYIPGINREEKMPLQDYKEKEFKMEESEP